MAKRNAPKKLKQDTRLLGLSLVIAGTLLVGVSTTHNILRLRSLRLDQMTVQRQIQANPLTMESDKDQYPAHIYIQWFVDVDIEPGGFVGNHVSISPDKATFLMGSGKVGQKGNLIIFGHNRRDILGNIRVLKGYEKIELTLKDGTKKMYQVTSLQEVDPAQTSLLQPTDREVLTIYTCSGLLDSRRFVVRAEPVNESGQGASFESAR